MMPISMNCETWAIIATIGSVGLTFDEIKEEAYFAYNNDEIDFSDYCRIMNYIENKH